MACNQSRAGRREPVRKARGRGAHVHIRELLRQSLRVLLLRLQLRLPRQHGNVRDRWGRRRSVRAGVAHLRPPQLRLQRRLRLLHLIDEHDKLLHLARRHLPSAAAGGRQQTGVGEERAMSSTLGRARAAGAKRGGRVCSRMAMGLLKLTSDASAIATTGRTRHGSKRRRPSRHQLGATAIRPGGIPLPRLGADAPRRQPVDPDQPQRRLGARRWSNDAAGPELLPAPGALSPPLLLCAAAPPPPAPPPQAARARVPHSCRTGRPRRSAEL